MRGFLIFRGYRNGACLKWVNELNEFKVKNTDTGTMEFGTMEFDVVLVFIVDFEQI